MSETGIIGLLLISSFYLFCLIKYINLLFYKTNKPEILLYLGLVVCLFPLFPAGNIFGSYLSIFLYIYVGLILNISFKKNE